MNLLLLVLLATNSQIDSEACQRTGERCRQSRAGRPEGGLAFLEFAPSSGAGMTAPCACTSPTGAKGEVLTLARGSDATCSKQGLATTGIANGDLVTCTGAQPRVEPSGGVASLRVEAARTNLIQRNQEFDNGYWTTASGGAPNPGLPTITANAADGPLGATTADRIDFGSTTGTGFGVVYNAAGRASTAAQYAHSLYVRGVSGGGTIYLMSTTGAAYITTACTFVSTSWSRCGVVGTETAVTWYTQIGFDLRDGAQSGQGAQSVYVALVQGELGDSVSSPIVTVASSVTRNAESPYLTIPAMTAGTYCVFANFETNINVTGTSRRVVTLWQAAGVWTDDYFPAPRYTAFLFDGATTSVLSTETITTAGRVGSYYDLANLSVCVNGVCNSTAGVRAINNITRVRLGVDGAGGTTGHLNGLLGRVQVDPSPSRCTR